MLDNHPTFTPEELQSEIWEPVIEYQAAYEVSDLGRVRRLLAARGTTPGKILKQNLCTPYAQVTLCLESVRRCKTVHILVALAFIGPCPEGKEVNHKDGNTCNNRVSNLEYLTPEENKEHATKNGFIEQGDRHWSRRNPELVARGSRQGGSVLNEEIVKEIKSRLKTGEAVTAIARQMSAKHSMTISHSLVSYIRSEKIWKHISV